MNPRILVVNRREIVAPYVSNGGPGSGRHKINSRYSVELEHHITKGTRAIVLDRKDQSKHYRNAPEVVHRTDYFKDEHHAMDAAIQHAMTLPK